MKHYNKTVRAHAAFTLFEVLVSMGIISVAILSSVLLLVNGVKTQELARARIYASTVAMSLVARMHHNAASHHSRPKEIFGPILLGTRSQPDFTGTPPSTKDLRNLNVTDLDKYGLFPPIVNASNFRMSVESTIGSRGGLWPVPPDIASRLDSPNDEIQQILDDGGLLYYPAPITEGGDLETTKGVSGNVESEQGRLIFAVVGYQQENVINHHPMGSWPYYDSYPHPPRLWELINGRRLGWAHWTDEVPATSWTTSGDTITSFSTAHTNSMAHLVYLASRHCSVEFIETSGSFIWDEAQVSHQTAIGAFYESSKTLAGQLGFTTSPLPTAVVMPPTNPTAQQVLALNWWAMAATMKTIPGFSNAGGGPVTSSDTMTATEADVLREMALHWAVRYGDADPYAWGAPRVANRAVMTDWPILGEDLFSPAPQTSFNFSAGGTWTAAARDSFRNKVVPWRIIAPTSNRKPRDFYIGNQLATVGVDVRGFEAPALWSDWAWTTISAEADFPTLDRFTAPVSASFRHAEHFEPSQRTRQLVCWMVDWKSYEDFESAPSADLSIAKHDRVPNTGGNPIPWGFNRGGPNPEMLLSWNSNGRTQVATKHQIGYGAFGAWGADRNGNGRFDQGTVKPSVRLKATMVGRWNLYDPILPLALGP